MKFLLRTEANDTFYKIENFKFFPGAQHLRRIPVLGGVAAQPVKEPDRCSFTSSHGINVPGTSEIWTSEGHIYSIAVEKLRSTARQTDYSAVVLSTAQGEKVEMLKVFEKFWKA